MVEHEHSGIGKDVTAVPVHYHASAATLSVPEDIDIGPDHAHTAVEGGQASRRAHPFFTKRTAGSGYITGAPTSDTIAAHTHPKDGDAPERKRDGVQRVQTDIADYHSARPLVANRTGVAGTRFHTHLDAATPGGNPLHTHGDPSAGRARN